MAEITSYPTASPKGGDYLLGAQVGQPGDNPANPTKKFTVGSVLALGTTPLVQHVQKVITSAQLLSLNGGGSIELIGAPGAGKVIAPVSIVGFLDFNTTTYNFSDGPIIDGSSDAILTTFFNASSDEYFNIKLGGGFLEVNSALNLSTTFQTVTQGDSPLTLSILYRIVEFPS